MKATEQYFTVVQFIMLYKVVLTFELVDEILNCYNSNECHRPVVLITEILEEVSNLYFGAPGR